MYERIVIVFVGILLLTVSIPALAQEALYTEDFEAGAVEGWELEQGWRVDQDGGNLVLSGEGHHWTRLQRGQEWTDYSFKSRLKLIRGGIHLNYRVSEEGRYFIGFREDGLYLNKEAPWGKFFGLAVSDVRIGFDGWHDIEIRGEGGKIQVYVDGLLAIDVIDDTPLTAGSIAFETIDDSFAYIDNVEVNVNIPLDLDNIPTDQIGSLITQSIPVYFSADSAQFPRQVGKVTLPYPGGNKTVYIEDVSPDYDTTVQRPNTMPWGVMLAVSASGPQDASSPATSWTARNGPVLDDGVAAVDAQNHLIVFYWDPDDVADEQNFHSADWKAVDVSEKTGKYLAREQPTSWTVTANSVNQNHIAARASNNDHLIDFVWQSGQDWRSTDISAATGQNIGGPPTSWQLSWSNQTTTRLAARSSNNSLIVFSHDSAGKWSANNLYGKTGKKITGTPFGWAMDDGRERIAAQDGNNHLQLFTRAKDTGKWSVQDISKATNGATIQGRVTAWQHGKTQHIAARNPKGDLLVFKEGIIDPGWTVTNVSAATGHKINNVPSHWLTQNGPDTVTHLVAPKANGHIMVFYQGNNGKWNTIDVTSDTGVKAALPLSNWIRSTSAPSEHLAVPSLDGRMHVFDWQPNRNWQALDVSTRSAGRAVYAASPFAGVWLSRDYGVSWKQSKQKQPKEGDTSVPGSLPLIGIIDIAVSPADPNLVFAATDRDRRFPSLAGLYRSTNGGKTWQRVYKFDCPVSTNSTDRILESVTQIVFAPDDPNRVYAAGGCAIARSEKGGLKGTWEELHPPGTETRHSVVYHLAVSGQLGRSKTNRIIAACGDGSFWLSRQDGAANSWQLDSGTGGLPKKFCGKAYSQSMTGARNIALEPGAPNHVYLVFPNQANGPSYNHKTKHGKYGHLCNIPVVYDGGTVNGKFDSGDILIRLNRVRPEDGDNLAYEKKIRYVETGGTTNAWDNNETIIYDGGSSDGVYDKGDSVIKGEVPATTSHPVKLSNDQRLKYLEIEYGSKTSPFGSKECGEGSLWYGDVSALDPKKRLSGGTWSQLPGPPVYGVGKDGAVSITTRATKKDFLLFFNDRATLHVSKGHPKAAGWYRLDGLTPSEAHRLGQPNAPTAIHVDPHGMDVSSTFDLTLKASDQDYPYNLNSELDKCVGGRVWLANDGGVYFNDDCGRLADGATNRKWDEPLTGLNTLWTLNTHATASGRLRFRRSLYTGTTHDDDFFSMNDGRTWSSAESVCGDCDTWWGDLYQVNRVLRLSPRDRSQKGEFDVFVGQTGMSPDASMKPSDTPYPDGTRPFAVSWKTVPGYRPQVQSLPNETPPAKGDYLVIQKKSNGDHVLLRAYNSIDGKTNSGFSQVGRKFPTRNNSVANVIQAAGGHSHTVYYIGDGQHIWRWRGDKGNDGLPKPWDLIVPSTDGNATVARRFFVNPWNASLLYLIDDNGVRRSIDGGDHWELDANLSKAVSGANTWQLDECTSHGCLLNDMAFDPDNGQRRFAAGLAGVFFTADGTHWFRLLDTRALPSRPLSLWFDPITDSNNATLFVTNMGRGILRLHPIPDVSPGHAILILNGGFEKKTLDWTTLGKAWPDSNVVYKGEFSNALGGSNDAKANLKQNISVPCDSDGVAVSFWWYNQTQEGREGGDVLRVHLRSKDGVRHIADFVSITSPRDQWTHAAYRLPEVGCGEMTLHFDVDNNGNRPTTFYLDEVSVMAYLDHPYDDVDQTSLKSFAPLDTQPGNTLSMP